MSITCRSIDALYWSLQGYYWLVFNTFFSMSVYAEFILNGFK